MGMRSVSTTVFIRESFFFLIHQYSIIKMELILESSAIGFLWRNQLSFSLDALFCFDVSISFIQKIEQFMVAKIIHR